MLQEEAEELGRPNFVDDLRKIEQAGRKLLELVEELREAPGRPASPRLTSSRGGTLGRSPESVPADEGTILVVDDNEMNLDVLSRRLARQGYGVMTAPGGREALEAVASDARIELVLLDVMMPGIDGLEVLRKLRQDHEPTDLPVIMATALGATDDVVEAFDLGANDYVTKPIDFPVVMARVRSQLSLKRARDEVRALNQRLAEAQERIGQLADSSGAALGDATSWATRALAEVADAVGVERIDLWLIEEGELASQTGIAETAPSIDELETIRRGGKAVARESDLLIPVIGLSGELFGALVVDREGETSLGEGGESLIGNFARHLASTLELEKMRRDLAAAAERRRARREELLEKGIDVLQLCPSCGRCYNQETSACEDDGEPLESPRVLPYHIGRRYRLLQRAGEGAMGTVFQALDERLERRVAVKVIRPEHFDEGELRVRFEQEARSAARIDHPGVVAVFDSGEIDGGSLYIVMEWLDGLDLRGVMELYGPGRPAQVADLLRQTSAALAAAHRAKLLHRDIKPENIFLTPEDGDAFRAKVLDFGVAKQIASDVNLTRTGSIIGTPLYMAPEQLAGEAVDERSDLYSLAAVAFQALTGCRSVRSKELSSLLFELRDRPTPKVSGVLPGVPPAVDRLFERGMARDAPLRPADLVLWAEETASAIEEIESELTGWEIAELSRAAAGKTKQVQNWLARSQLPTRLLGE